MKNGDFPIVMLVYQRVPEGRYRHVWIDWMTHPGRERQPPGDSDAEMSSGPLGGFTRFFFAHQGWF